jgi:hypothetical protein
MLEEHGSVPHEFSGTGCTRNESTGMNTYLVSRGYGKQHGNDSRRVCY